MAASASITQQAARLWADPTSRARIVAMHAKGASLLSMVSALGLDSVLDSDGLRDVVANLTPDEVSVIRDAFVTEAQSAPSDGAHFPVDCRVDNASDGVVVSAIAGAAGPIARISPAS